MNENSLDLKLITRISKLINLILKLIIPSMWDWLIVIFRFLAYALVWVSRASFGFFPEWEHRKKSREVYRPLKCMWKHKTSRRKVCFFNTIEVFGGGLVNELNGFWWGIRRFKKERKWYLCFYSKSTFRRFLPSSFRVMKGQWSEYNMTLPSVSSLSGSNNRDRASRL